MYKNSPKTSSCYILSLIKQYLILGTVIDMINIRIKSKFNHMKKSLLVILLICLGAGVIFAAPRAKIKVEYVTPYKLKTTPQLVPDSCNTTGLNVVAKGTWVYVNVFNFGDTTSVTSASWSLLSKPAGSGATITSISGLNWWAKFKADSTGAYNVKVTMTTSAGSKDTTMYVYAGYYVGVGNFQGVPAAWPQCMTCHGSFPLFQDIFNRWKVSGHAGRFKYQVDSAASYSTSCMKCHTTGYDHNKFALNNGFDDVARILGWVWTSPPHPGKWDSLKTYYPGLVNFATIGCENCHGPGSEHAFTGGDTNRINISYKVGVCAKCHDSPPNHNNYSEWSNSLHSHPVMEGRSVADSLRFNPMNDCNRCHDGESFIQFTKNFKGPLNLTSADQEVIGCPTCHDPHGNTNEFWLRNSLPGADTLQSGDHYNLGNGHLCLNCHKGRRRTSDYVLTRVTSSTWGPHESPQGDVLLGKNAASFGTPYLSGSHKNITNGCVGCHMSTTTDTGTVTRDKVGGHSMNMNYAPTNYDHVVPCQGCHPGVTSFDDFIAPEDFDGNGLVEAWQKEVKGVIRNLVLALPHTNDSTVSWQLIAADSNNVNKRKAFYNYQMIKNDKSFGIHNPFYEIQVLFASIAGTTGIQHNFEEVPNVYTLSQNYPNPFNPTTKIEFGLPKGEFVTLKVFDITGREVNTLVNMRMLAGKYTVIFDNSKNLASGIYFYRLVAGNNVITKKMMLVK